MKKLDNVSLIVLLIVAILLVVSVVLYGWVYAAVNLVIFLAAVGVGYVMAR